MSGNNAKDLEHFKANGNVYADIKPFLYFYVLFFLAFFALVIAEEMEWSETILGFSVLSAFGCMMGYLFFRDGTFCFAADQDGWYFREKGQMTLTQVKWSDCQPLTKQSQARGEGGIVFDITRSPAIAILNPKNANVSIKDDTISIEFTGLIQFQAKKVRALDALRSAAIARKE